MEAPASVRAVRPMNCLRESVISFFYVEYTKKMGHGQGKSVAHWPGLFVKKPASYGHGTLCGIFLQCIVQSLSEAVIIHRDGMPGRIDLVEIRMPEFGLRETVHI